MHKTTNACSLQNNQTHCLRIAHLNRLHFSADVYAPLCKSVQKFIHILCIMYIHTYSLSDVYNKLILPYKKSNF